jgi:hypothetical protein
MERDNGDSSFYISDDAPAGMQLAMRIAFFAETHSLLLNRFEEFLAVEDAPPPAVTLEELTQFFGDIDQTRKDIDSIFTAALTDNEDDLDVNEFTEAFGFLDGMRLNFLKLKTRQHGTTEVTTH